tara:strand:- start:3140 stop:3439 length:300 start_codon:yes stop_codon:yes gene_type:complete
MPDLNPFKGSTSQGSARNPKQKKDFLSMSDKEIKRASTRKQRKEDRQITRRQRRENRDRRKDRPDELSDRSKFNINEPGLEEYTKKKAEEAKKMKYKNQ